MIRKDELIDVPERRTISLTQFECRTQGNSLKFEGYASIFNKPYEVHGGPQSGGWDETVAPPAFKRTLTEKPDVVLLLNHEGLPLARTRSGTLQLSTDTTGLLSSSNLDMRDPDVKSLAIKYERGDLNDMSFAFRVKRQSWSEDETQRSLDEVSLHKGDVSIVTFGANPYTSSTLRAAVQMLARGELAEEQLAELRSMDAEVARAMDALQAARDDKPYGDVAYADPKNGKYPIDTKEHVKAAWSYINMPKNQTGYTAEELASIKGKIKAAAKKFGIEISDEAKSDFVAEIIKLADTRAMDDLEGGDVFDQGEPRDSTLAQAIHDLCADEDGVNCDPTNLPNDDPIDGNNDDDDMQSYSLGSSPTGTILGGPPNGPESNSMSNDASIACFTTPAGQSWQVQYGGAEKLCNSLAEAAEWLRRKSAPTGTWVDELGARNLNLADLDVNKMNKPVGRTYTIAEAMRAMRPEGAPEPFSIIDAERLAS